MYPPPALPPPCNDPLILEVLIVSVDQNPDVGLEHLDSSVPPNEVRNNTQGSNTLLQNLFEDSLKPWYHSVQSLPADLSVRWESLFLGIDLENINFRTLTEDQRNFIKDFLDRCYKKSSNGPCLDTIIINGFLEYILDFVNAALRQAGENGETEEVKILRVLPGANINSQDSQGNTVLILAVRNGHLEVVETLLLSNDGQSIDFTIHNNEGDTALRVVLRQWIRNKDNEETLGNINQEKYKKILYALFEARNFLEDDFEGINIDHLLRIAVRKGLRDVVKDLLEAGAYINGRDANGNTPLMLAIYYNYIEIAKDLLAYRIKIKKANSNNYTALHFASAKGLVEIVDNLVALGGNINTRDSNGNTSLMLAVYYKHIEVVRALLVAQNIKVDSSRSEDINNSTFLAYVVAGKYEIVSALITLPEINVSFRDKRGYTPLVHAAIHGHLAIVKLLLDKRKKLSTHNVAIEDPEINLAYTLAINGKHFDVAKLLEENGATKTQGTTWGDRITKYLFSKTSSK